MRDPFQFPHPLNLRPIEYRPNFVSTFIIRARNHSLTEIFPPFDAYFNIDSFSKQLKRLDRIRGFFQEPRLLPGIITQDTLALPCVWRRR